MSEMEPLLMGMPWYAWLVAFVVIIVIFGDRVLWDYEIKFPMTEGVGDGEIEFECHKRKGTQFEARLNLESNWWGEDIEVFLNNAHVYTISKRKNEKGRPRILEQVEFEKPNVGDIVEVRIRGEVVLTGPLVLD